MAAWLKGWRLAGVVAVLAFGGALCWWWWKAPRPPSEEARAAAYAARLGEAEKALAAGELEEARAKLADCDPALRGWEWYALGTLADGVPPARPLTPMQYPGQAVLSANGRAAAALFDPGDVDASLHAFDLAAGKRLLRFPREGVAGKYWGERVALSADGRLLGTASGHHYFPRRIPFHTVIAGGRAMGKVGDRLRGDFEWVRLEKIDGRWVEAERHVERRGFAMGIDLQTRLPLEECKAHDSCGPIALGGPKRFYAASGDSLSLAGGGASGQGPPGGDVTSLDLSPDEKLLAVGRSNGVLQLLDAGTGAERLRVSAAEKADAVNWVRFSPDGGLFAVSDAGGVTVRDTAGGKLLARIAGRHAAMAFAPDGRLLLAHAPQRKEPLTLKGRASWDLNVAFSPDGKRIAAGGEDGTVKVWDASTGRVALTLHGHTGAVFGVTFSPDGTRIAAGAGGTVKVWDAGTGQETLSLQGHKDSVRGVAFSPDGKRIASGGQDQMVKVWDAGTGRETLTFKGHTDYVTSVAFSPDGKLIASGSFGPSQTVKVWDAGTGQETLSRQGHQGFVSRVAFSPDGKRVASGGKDETVKVWDAKSGRVVFTFKGHTATVTSVAFSPDGKRIASGDEDGTVKVWEFGTGQVAPALQGDSAVAVHEPRSGLRLCGLPGLADRVADLACRADGTLVVLGVIGPDLAARELGLGDRDEEWLTAAIEDAGRDAASRAYLLRRRSEMHTRRGNLEEARHDLEAAHALDPAGR